jgi:long-chain fatty acid transport protein
VIRISRATALVLVVLCAFATRRAAASGFSTLAFLPDYATAVTDTPFGVYTNPASLRAGEGLRLLLDGSLALRRASFQRAVSDVPEPSDAQGANVGEATLHNAFVLPSLSAALGVGPVTLGLALHVPFGGAQSWDKNRDFEGDPVYVGAVDSPARFHAIDGLWTTAYATLGAAYQIPGTRFSVGASGSFVYTRLELSQAITAARNDSLNAEGRMNTELSGATGAFGLGLHWEVLERRLWLGLSYLAPPGLWSGHTIDGPLRTNFGSGENEEPIRLEQSYPDQILAAARFRPDKRYELRLSGYYQRFGVVRSQCLARGDNACDVGDDGLVPANSGPFSNFVRRWHDALGARFAASAFVGSRLEVFFAASWDGNAVPKGTLEPGLIDGHDLGGTLGGYFAATQSLRIGLSYMQQLMLTRDNTGQSVLNRYEFPNTMPSAQGRYRQAVGVLNLSLFGSFDTRL